MQVCTNTIIDERPFETPFSMIPKEVFSLGNYAARLYSIIDSLAHAIYNATDRIVKLCKSTLLAHFKSCGGHGSERTYAQGLVQLRKSGYLLQIQSPSSKHGEWEWYYYLLKVPNLDYKGVIRIGKDCEIKSIDNKRVEPGQYELPENIKEQILSQKGLSFDVEHTVEAPSDSSVDNLDDVIQSEDDTAKEIADIITIDDVEVHTDCTDIEILESIDRNCLIVESDEGSNIENTVLKDNSSDLIFLRKKMKSRLIDLNTTTRDLLSTSKWIVLSAVICALARVTANNNNLKINDTVISKLEWLFVAIDVTEDALISLTQTIINRGGLQAIRHIDNYVAAGIYKYIQAHDLDFLDNLPDKLLL